MIEPIVHDATPKSDGVYLDADRARSLAVSEQDAALGCRKRVLAKMGECPVLDSGADDASAAVLALVAGTKELVSDQEDATEQATLGVLHKTFAGIDLDTGVDAESKARIKRAVGEA